VLFCPLASATASVCSTAIKCAAKPKYKNRNVPTNPPDAATKWFFAAPPWPVPGVIVVEGRRAWAFFGDARVSEREREKEK
jgi:hypothetical protein